MDSLYLCYLQRSCVHQTGATPEPIERRASHSLTFSANPEQVPEIRDLLEKSLQQICKRMQRGKRTQVYQGVLSLFPLTQPEKEKSS